MFGKKPDFRYSFLQTVSLLKKLYPIVLIQISYPERVLSVNGYRIETQEDVEFILDGLSINERVTVQIARSGSVRDVSLTLIPFYNSRCLISQILVGMFFFAISIFVYVKNPNQIEAVVYHWGMVACTVIIFTTRGKYSIEPFGIGHFIRIVFSTAYALTPVLFLHFTFVFPKTERQNLQNHSVYVNFKQE
ncbi:MAG: hypothetical protein KJ666_01990 [Bacteroidetes bacterium]|nr:hypothetical protein [Bacteroidota bacterium]MBU2585258.1 hypothetical protein [Bacteroidota bacterium]